MQGRKSEKKETVQQGERRAAGGGRGPPSLKTDSLHRSPTVADGGGFPPPRRENAAPAQREIDQRRACRGLTAVKRPPAGPHGGLTGQQRAGKERRPPGRCILGRWVTRLGEWLGAMLPKAPLVWHVTCCNSCVFDGGGSAGGPVGSSTPVRCHSRTLTVPPSAFPLQPPPPLSAQCLDCLVSRRGVVHKDWPAATGNTKSVHRTMLGTDARCPRHLSDPSSRHLTGSSSARVVPAEVLSVAGPLARQVRCLEAFHLARSVPTGRCPTGSPRRPSGAAPPELQDRLGPLLA